MRVLVCGDRNWSDQGLIDQTLDAIHAKIPITNLAIVGIRGNKSGSIGMHWVDYA